MRFKSLRKSLVHIEWSFVLHRGVDQSGIQSGRGLIGLLAQISAHLPDLIAIEIDGGHTLDIAAVSEDVRVRYYETHQHLQDNRTDYVDLRNIKEALFFLAPLFHGSIQFEKDIWSVIAKTQRLLKESSPVAE